MDTYIIVDHNAIFLQNQQKMSKHCILLIGLVIVLHEFRVLLSPVVNHSPHQLIKH